VGSHKFAFYNLRLKLKVNEPTLKNPVIFNMLGNTAEDGKYIFTHKQFYNYINQKQEVKVPFEIETKIKNVAHYLFIGFDFNKWYNRLLLFALNLYNEAEAYSFEADKLDEIHLDYVNKEFNISFIDNKYDKFIDILLQKAKQQELTIDLIKTFIENTIKDISEMSANSEGKDMFEELSNIENKINTISDSIS